MQKVFNIREVDFAPAVTARARTLRALSVVGLATISIFGRPALADFIQPGSIHIKTADYRFEPIKFAVGTYHYDVSWEGIPVASAEVTVRDRSSGGVRYLFVEAKAHTARAINLIYNLKHTSQSVFRADTLEPVSFYSEQTVNSKTKIRRVTFHPDGSIISKGWKDGEEEDEYDFHSDNLTLDPISAAFLARSLTVKEANDSRFDVFNGKHRYLIGFEIMGRESTRVEGKSYDAFKVKPSVQKLTDTEGEKRLKSAFLWVSADGNNEILKLESKVLIGSVTAELEGFDAGTDADAGPIVEAALRQAAIDPSARARLATP